jgi:hypothetical protein
MITDTETATLRGQIIFEPIPMATTTTDTIRREQCAQQQQVIKIAVIRLIRQRIFVTHSKYSVYYTETTLI